MYKAHDSIGFYLSGATVAGASQKVDLSSLGGCRGAERVQCLRWHRYNPVTGLRVEYVSGACGPGLARLQVVSADTVRFAAPGDSFGDTVRLGVGRTAKVVSYKVDDATCAQRYCVVFRPAIGDLGGFETLQLMDVANNAVGGSNFSTAESTAGAYHYRCLFIRNDSDVGSSDAPRTITNLKVWLDSAANLAIALEEPTGDEVDDVSDETTAPVGPSFTSPTSYAAGLAVPSLTAGSTWALWIRNAIPASNTTPEPARSVLIHYADSATTPTVAGTLRGVARVAVAGITGYRIWAGQDAEPDYGTPPDLDLPTLPDDIVLTPEHTYYLRCTYRNEYGLESAPQSIAALHVAADGSLGEDSPRGPDAVSLASGPDGAIVVRAQYLPNYETVTVADEWRIYVSDDGDAPDPDIDTPIEVSMTTSVELVPVSLSHTTVATYQDGLTVNVLVRTYRSDDGAESTNTTYQSVTINALAPGRPQGTASIGTRLGITPTVVTPTEQTYYIDQAKDIRLVANADGSVSFYVDTELVWRVFYSRRTDIGGYVGSTIPDKRRFFIPDDWAIDDTTDITTSGSEDTFEVVTWDPSDRVVAMTANGTHRMLIDATNKTITVGSISDQRALSTTVPADLAHGRTDGAYLTTWDAAAEELRVISQTSTTDEYWRIGVGINDRYTQAEIEAM